MTGNKALFLLAVTAVLSIEAARASNITRCDGTLDTKSVTVSGCDSFPCRMKKGSTFSIVQRFTPDHDISELTVVAKMSISLGLFSVPWNYPGIHGSSAFGKIYNAADNTLASRPLKKGVEYIYKDDMLIYDLYYFTVNAKVRCGLQERGEDITCYNADIVIY